jgi:hypothetical protein
MTKPTVSCPKLSRWALPALLLATGCGAAEVGSVAAGQSPTIRISPSSVNLQVRATTDFSATVTGVVLAGVQWSVVESNGGSINAAGSYTAPAAAGTFHVVARAQGAETLSTTATVYVTNGGSSSGGGSSSSSSSSSGGSSSGGSSGGGMPTPDCATAPLRSTGTVYYYCDCQSGADAACQAGNDANAGTSPSAPRRSIADAFNRLNAMSAGNTVALCRGGVWSGGGYIQNTRCSAANPCELRDYVPSWGSASTARPRLSASSGTLVGFANVSQGGFRIWNLDLRNGDMNQTDGTLAVFDDVHDLDVCNVRIEGSYAGMNFQPTSTSATHITVRGCQFYNTGFCGFYGGSPGISITGNYFSNNGLIGSMTMHSVYLISETGGGVPPDAASTATYTFANNNIETDGRCGGVMVVVHGVFRNNQLVIENNRLVTTSTNPYCFGMQTSGGLAGAEFHNAIVRRNRITTTGQSAMEFSCCQDCQVSSNLAVSGGIDISTSNCNPGNFMGARVTLQNNTMYGRGLTVGNQGSSSGYVVENNAVSTSGSCFSISPSTTRNANNACNASGMFVNAGGGDFRPANPGPLVGAASQTYFSPVAIGTVSWDPTDPGVARSAGSVDIGAFQR